MRNTKKIVAYVFAGAVLLAVACLTPPVRLGLQFLGLGIKNGAADKRTGIKYSTEDVGWRIFSNGNDWTPGDQELVRLAVAASPAASRRYVSLFHLGYRCGMAGALFWLAPVLLAVLLGLALFYRKRIRRTRRMLL